MATKELNIRGPTGAKGPIGNQGATGATGATGAQGPGGAAGQAGQTKVSANANNQASIGTDAGIFAPNQTQPVANNTRNGMLASVSGLTTDYVNGQNQCADLATALRPTIWKIRQRNYNALGNPNFEVNERLGAATGAAGWGADRWLYWTAGALSTAHSTGQSTTSASLPVIVPGGSYIISGALMTVSVTTQVPSLAATDGHTIYQVIEGAIARELAFGNTSIQLLCHSTVAPLKFCVALRDNNSTHSLCKLCTIPTANTWTLIQLPNIPAFPSAGNFPIAGGQICYNLLISLGMGSSYIPPANDVWQNGNFYGAVGQDNFFANPVNSIFRIGFVQHEPGPTCNNLIELPYHQNLRQCQRYFQKSLGFGVAIPGGITANNYKHLGEWVSSTTCRLSIDFLVPLASWPASPSQPGILYGYNSTAPNQVYVDGVGNVGCGAPTGDPRGMMQVVLTSTPTITGPNSVIGEWSADTGW